MIANISPSRASGQIVAPPSKSVAHRALICGALSPKSRIENLAFSKDIEATLDCLKKLGAKVSIDGDTVEIGGLDPFNVADKTELWCNESGSTLRFIIPLCMLCDNNVVLSGEPRLMERPLGIYNDIAKNNGIEFVADKQTIKVKGLLKAGKYIVPGNVSSQFITGLLFALPLLEGDSTIEISGKFESASYVDITVHQLKFFGIEIDRKDNVFFVKGNQKYNSMTYVVEGDCSNAAIIDAFNYIGSDVDIKGIPQDTKQGDAVYKHIFEEMKNGNREFDLSDCPDLAPVLFALAAAFGGDYTFNGTARLKIKESDRAAAMKEELKKFGADLDVFDNSVYVKPCCIQKPSEILSSHNDHRIAMSLAVLCSITGGIIENAQAVAKSFPNYFELLKSIGIGIVLE